MIDIKSELLNLRQLREQEYISVVELLDFLKKHNPNSLYPEIATYLLVKLSPNDVRKTEDEIWGDVDFECWIEQNGISVFEVPSKIDEKVKNLHPNLFFEALETVRDFDDILFYDDPEMVTEYLKENQLGIYIKRKRIEELLNIDTTDHAKALNELIEGQATLVAMALTKTEEFIKNTDINKSPVGTAERLVFQQHLTEKDKIIEELQAEIENLKKPEIIKSAVNYEDFSIHGHTTDEIKVIFEVIKRYWLNYDLSQPDTIANAKDITEWIEKNYPSISRNNREAIQRITRPNQAKAIGRKGV
ncbi:hypothetical protein [Rodentibacter haemolyticus]|uniref:Uncharacterized protein n=1 Tax=Rodentibacter haemolyticus TaxID=2778911 RepID=A0ABX6UYV8_9PAST|nr:hypothetical protein [Rodentibacter haemolyticus]QPB42659.1 hypothetical protein IHV77_00590 [Rodentibacter haemolyticus]